MNKVSGILIYILFYWLIWRHSKIGTRLHFLKPLTVKTEMLVMTHRILLFLFHCSGSFCIVLAKVSSPLFNWKCCFISTGVFTFRFHVWIIGSWVFWCFFNCIGLTTSDGRVLINSKLEGMWREVVMVCYKVQSQHLAGGTEESHRNRSQDGHLWTYVWTSQMQNSSSIWS
jgi:hypothetical protein